MKTLKVFLVVLYILQYYMSLGRQIKMIYERDMSEHCRRRVMPSVFLGRKVVEANARILQFSRLELPYSCFIIVRSESGNNMVMMIQVMAQAVQEVCKANEQLLVYEMGETFGGYWGPLPDSVLRREPLPPQIYTLKTTRSTSTTTESPTEEDSPTTRSSTASATVLSDQLTGDYVEVEVPVVNVSVHLVPTNENHTVPSSDDEEPFDLQDDVTPIPGAEYNRKILPLVQFRIADQGRRSKTGDEGHVDVEPPKYDLEQFILQDFTPDLRLTLPPLKTTSKRRNHKQGYQATRRLNFRKHRTLFHSQKQHRRVMSETITGIRNMPKYEFPTTRKFTKDKKNTKAKYTQDSWKEIADLLKKLNKDKEKSSETTLSLRYATLMEKISNLDHSKSAYLASNLSIYESNDINDAQEYISTNKLSASVWDTASLILNSTEEYRPREPTTKEIEIKTSAKIIENVTDKDVYITNETSITIITESMQTTEAKIREQVSTVISTQVSTAAFQRTSASPIKSIKQNEDAIKKMTVSDTYLKDISTDKTISTTSNTENPIKISTEYTSMYINKMTTGSMVGHESWENVVQAAPEMAVLLNQSVVDITRGGLSDEFTKEARVTEATHKNVLKKRKKRDIHSIAIENARPHNLTTQKTVVTTTKLSINIGDMQKFAQLVELQDDEMHGRVALRYLRQYVGPPLFNLCDVTDPTKPHVFLFNSSRIVLSLTNFTLERMVIILTAARALRSGEVRCPRTRLECQVSGARVCMDSMVACDGVPNCGSYDIYDEDRLLCGHTASMQRNVYLAAFTFLAVLLTVIYAIHYWLKRCVPKVADAFFIYSDGVENILYLDSIMRSPHDIDDPKLAYQSHLYGDDIYDEDIEQPHRNACQRFLRKICCCCFRSANKKPHETENIDSNVPTVPKRMYSFTELEIRKMLTTSKDTAVQTGDSLQMNFLRNSNEKNATPLSLQPGIRPAVTSYDFSVTLKDSLLTLEEPLPEEHKDELSLLKFFRESRSDIVAAHQPKRESTFKKKSYQAIDIQVESPSEQELEIHTYDRRTSEPGPSKVRNTAKERGSPLGSVSKHLRFDEVPTTIPSKGYDDDNEDTKGNEGRRVVTLGDRNRRSSRPLLDPIEEGDEHSGGTKDHRHFWRSSKSKKSKKGQVSLR